MNFKCHFDTSQGVQSQLVETRLKHRHAEAANDLARRQRGVDLVFLVDATGSMVPSIV